MRSNSSPHSALKPGEGESTPILVHGIPLRRAVGRGSYGNKNWDSVQVKAVSLTLKRLLWAGGCMPLADLGLFLGCSLPHLANLKIASYHGENQGIENPADC